MRLVQRCAFAICLLAAMLGATRPASVRADASDINVLTNRYDNGRSGANLAETTLTTANVSAGSFGLLYSLGPVDGNVYGQPLYVADLATSAGTFNTVIVVTEHNSVYAFDADGRRQEPLWRVNLGRSVAQDPGNDPYGALVPDCRNLTPEIGVTSTPVIDPSSATLYAVAKTRDDDGSVRQRLHRLDLGSGSSKGVVEIQAAMMTDDAAVVFNPETQLNRPGLLLSNGVVYVAFGSMCDYGEYHGWILGYDAATLAAAGAYTVTPTGYAGAIWQSGTGLSADAQGNIYALTGNGTFTEDGANLSDSFIRLSPAPALQPLDWFTPKNQNDLADSDSDLGSSGVVIVPGTSLLLGAGKEGRVYLVGRDNMGRFDPADDHVIQALQVTDRPFERNIHGAPVWWWSPAGGRMYVWGEGEELKAFAYDGTRLHPDPIGRGSAFAPGEGAMPGGIVSLSANGSLSGTGIVWSTVPRSLDASNQIVPGVLHAFDAEDVGHELWNSDVDPADELGMFAKFNPPIVANGKVFAATFSGVVRVYGLREGVPPPPGPAALPAPWRSDDVGDVGIAGSAVVAAGAFLINGGGADIWSNADSFHFVHQPLAGDGQIVARVISIQDTNTYAKAGVMLRTSLVADAAHVVLDVRPGGEIEFMTRNPTGATTTFVAGAFGAPAVWLKLSWSGTIVTASTSRDGTSWAVVGSVPLSGSVLAGLAVTSHQVGVLNQAWFGNVGVGRADPAPTASDVPAPPWRSDDVGHVGIAGSAVVADGAFVINGGGADIWSNADSFHFVHQPLGGDGQIVARVTSIQDTNTYAKAGVMLRTSLEADAAHVVLDVRPGGDIEFMTRNPTGATTTFVAGAFGAPAVWLKLSWSGTIVTGSTSGDGTSWAVVGSVPLSGSVLAGLAVTSHQVGVLNQACFDNVGVGPADLAPTASDVPAPPAHFDTGPATP
jgi:hypothetical protein